jgi:hypothetical protein
MRQTPCLKQTFLIIAGYGFLSLVLAPKFQIMVILVHSMDASWAGIKDAPWSGPWDVFSNREKY